LLISSNSSSTSLCPFSLHAALPIYLIHSGSPEVIGDSLGALSGPTGRVEGPGRGRPGEVDEGEKITAYPARFGSYHSLHRVGGDGGVDGVAAPGQDGDTGTCGETMGSDDDVSE